MMADTISLNLLNNLETGGRTERADAAANRQLVLVTAARLFAEHGVPAVTMADIAQAAEIGKGTLYRRFANKAELCLALMDEQMAEFQNGMLAEMRMMSAAGRPYLSQLATYMSRLVVFTQMHAPLLCEVEQSDLLLENVHPELPYLWHSMTVTSLLRTAQRNGEISPRLDVEFYAEALLATIQVDTLRFQLEVRRFSTERIIAGLQSMIDALKTADSF